MNYLGYALVLLGVIFGVLWRYDDLWRQLASSIPLFLGIALLIQQRFLANVAQSSGCERCKRVAVIGFCAFAITIGIFTLLGRSDIEQGSRNLIIFVGFPIGVIGIALVARYVQCIREVNW